MFIIIRHVSGGSGMYECCVKAFWCKFLTQDEVHTYPVPPFPTTLERTYTRTMPETLCYICIIYTDTMSGDERDTRLEWEMIYRTYKIPVWEGVCMGACVHTYVCLCAFAWVRFCCAGANKTEMSLSVRNISVNISTDAG